MPTVELRFSPLPAHVRTARLVAAAVARRAGLDEAVLDEVRLAVGEACSRAVDLHRQHCPQESVQVLVRDDEGVVSVEVADSAPAVPAPAGELPEEMQELSRIAELDLDALPGGVGLAVVSGLVDSFEVRRAGSGLSVRMSWQVQPGASSPR